MTTQAPLTTHINSKILGHNIKEGRKRMGNMPQKELAELVGISRHTLIDIEAGKRDTSLGKVAEIAKYLQIPLTQLLETSTHEGLKSKQHILKEGNINSNARSTDQEMFETLIEHLRGHLANLEKTCADLREDKISLREELNAIKIQLNGQQRG